MFGVELQAFEPVPPHLVQVTPELAQALEACAIEAACAHPAFCDEPGVPKHPEVLADGRWRDREMARDLPGRQLAIANECEDLAPARFDESSKGGIHDAV